MSDWHQLANKIATIRTTTGRTQTQFAYDITRKTHCPVSRGTLIRWESGATVPRLQPLIAIAQLGVTSLDDLLAPTPQLSSNRSPEFTLEIDTATDNLSAKIDQIKNHPADRSISEFTRAVQTDFHYHISGTRMGYWLKGTHLPNITSLYPLAHMGGITVDELLAHPYPLDLA
ncbi:helix-turn-helix domain-containing protein [Levilactobacillus spicheri]|uniref:HTH cro/C1-type domain-containing protein n=1 Tax=Levilactobacillus spicheri TaxID=216463 RepID=A0A0F3RS47_9LACO|nr:helix-turn-helix transcriptional regulator [Levilactobacillus spicheri]KJW12735.1 hypothetical protein VC81_06525 [Levilactobacillus spicheri]